MQVLTLTFLLLLSVSSLAQTEQQNVEQHSSNDVVWIDVRSRFEHALNSIKGDPNIPHNQIVSGVTEKFPDKNTPIRLYCAKGVRAGNALEQLIDAGYRDVQNAGGITEVRKLRFTAKADKKTETAPPVE